MQSKWDQYIDGRRESCPNLDTAELYPQFQDAFISRQRVEVTGPIFGTRRGYVGITTGWRPAFILLHNSISRSSPDVLGKDETITARIPGKYR